MESPSRSNKTRGGKCNITSHPRPSSLPPRKNEESSLNNPKATVNSSGTSATQGEYNDATGPHLLRAHRPCRIPSSSSSAAVVLVVVGRRRRSRRSRCSPPSTRRRLSRRDRTIRRGRSRRHRRRGAGTSPLGAMADPSANVASSFPSGRHRDGSTRRVSTRGER